VDEARPNTGEKRSVRAACLARRDCLTPAERAGASAAIVAELTAMAELREATTVMCFASFRTEVDTGPLLDWCLRHGKRLALPRVTGPRTLECRLVTDTQRDLEPGSWGILEPVDRLSALDPGEIDCVIVPGSAFDREGGRLGYGGGFYDAYLRLLRPDVPRVAGAFACQLCDEVPMEGHDLRIDALVTEEGVLRFRR
jgi:5-formyltetrahydrofolate cyclo-ligase